jgi:hypothetical protein
VKVEISFTRENGQRVRALFRPTVYPTSVDPGDGPELIWAFLDDKPLHEILEHTDDEAEAVCAALADEAEAAYENQMAAAYAAEDRFSDDDGLLYNADQQNDRRGWGGEAPEPCGHHCPSDCPRCGE